MSFWGRIKVSPTGGSRDMHNLSHQLREGDLGVLHYHPGCMGVFRPTAVQCRVLLFKITEHVNDSNTADSYVDSPYRCLTSFIWAPDELGEEIISKGRSTM